MDFDSFKGEVGNRLKLFIKKNRYTQKEFCELIGMGETALSAVIFGGKLNKTNILLY